MKKTIGTILAVTLLVVTLWIPQAQAVPGYFFSGYTNTIAFDDGSANAPYLGYGYYNLGLYYNPAVATSATSSYVDGLTAVLNFSQDPFVYTNPLDPFQPTDPAVNGIDFSLPGGGTSFTGTFAELYSLSFANNFLDLNFMDPDLQGALPLLSINTTGLTGANTLDLLTSFNLTNFTSGILGGADAPAGTIGNFIVDFTVDEVSYQSAPVPEPSTFALIGAGLIGLGFLRKRTGRS